jgi:hypothetical protein
MSLRRLLERFELSIKKGEFNYSLLKKDKLIDQEYKDLETYLYADLDGEDELFKFYYNMFIGFKKLMSEENQHKLCWLINKPGSTAYKCICHMAQLPEEYDEEEKEENSFIGGYVIEPKQDFIG